MRSRGSRWRSAAAVKPVTIGVAMIVWAITIAAGV